MILRRRTDPATSERRHSLGDRRATPHYQSGIRFPSRNEQAIQFLTRYLFAILGLIFFNYAYALGPKWLPLWQVNAILGLYLVLNSVCFAHAWWRPISPARYHTALWIDIVAVTICVATDPYDIPPSMVAYIVVVLGNGMRSGMRFFAEALLGTLAGGAFAIVIRYFNRPDVLTPGTIFLSLFGAIIIVYAYILMGRVEHARFRSEQVGRTDPLTGLLNRRGLSEAADGWLVNTKWRQHKSVVMFADLDNFKLVNDRHGHSEGDRVLAYVASIMLSALRSTDLIARYGGDEFVLLLADADLAEAQIIAGRIQVTIDQWFRENEFACGISIGFGEVPQGEWNLNRVLQSVDRLLYQSKAQRGGDGIRRVELI